MNLFACVSSYCLSCGNNEVNFLNLVFPITNALAVWVGNYMRQSFAFNTDSQTVRSSLV